MPSTAFFLKAISVFFQYGMLLVLLAYLARFLRITAGEFRRERASLQQAQVAPHAAVLSVVQATDSSAPRGRRRAVRA